MGCFFLKQRGTCVRLCVGIEAVIPCIWIMSLAFVCLAFYVLRKAAGFVALQVRERCMVLCGKPGGIERRNIVIKTTKSCT